jgi:hypothetical protein
VQTPLLHLLRGLGMQIQATLAAGKHARCLQPMHMYATTTNSHKQQQHASKHMHAATAQICALTVRHGHWQASLCSLLQGQRDTAGTPGRLFVGA